MANQPSAGEVGSTGAAKALHQTEEQMQANATGSLAPADINSPAGTGQPQSLPQQDINLTSPVVPENSGRQRMPFTIVGNTEPEIDQIGGGATENDGSGHHGGSSSEDRAEGELDTFDEVLGSGNLLKNVKPKSSPMSSEDWEGVSVDGEDTNDFNVSLKKVPSYSKGMTSDRRPNRLASALNRHFEPRRRRITILSMDGGGMRGLIAARCLAHLESLLQSKTGTEVKLCDYFDFLAGTSTGAILTLMISTPDEKGDPLFSGQGCCQFYARNGREIFRPRWYDPWRGSLRQLYRPKYSPSKFEKLLKNALIRRGKALTMRDTLRPFLVTSFDISRAAPHIFVRQAAMKDDSRNFRLWEVCRASASAPTYFRPAEVISTDGKTSATLIDGGAIQNNPALVAMTHVLGNNEEFPEAVGLQDVLAGCSVYFLSPASKPMLRAMTSAREVYEALSVSNTSNGSIGKFYTSCLFRVDGHQQILSLGAGQLDEKFDLRKARKWGMAGWVRPLLNIMMDGSSDTIDYQLAAGFAGHNCSENYLRIQLLGLPNKTALMDCSTRENIQDLIQVTDDLLQEKAVMRNEFGEKVTLSETYAERLSWFADQLIEQKKLRERGGSMSIPQHPTHNDGSGLGPTTQVVSPMYGHLFMHQQLHHNGLSKPLETAKSVRF